MNYLDHLLGVICFTKDGGVTYREVPRAVGKFDVLVTKHNRQYTLEIRSQNGRYFCKTSSRPLYLAGLGVDFMEGR